MYFDLDLLLMVEKLGNEIIFREDDYSIEFILVIWRPESIVGEYSFCLILKSSSIYSVCSSKMPFLICAVLISKMAFVLRNEFNAFSLFYRCAVVGLYNKSVEL